MPVLIKKIEGEIGNSNNIESSVKILNLKASFDIEDYVKIPGLTAFLQNYLHTLSVTELFIDGLDAYRAPDDGNHPILGYYGLPSKSNYTELTISYT